MLKYIVAGAIAVVSLATAGNHIVSVSHAQSTQSTKATAKVRTSDWKIRRDANKGVLRIVSGRLPTTAFRATAELAKILRIDEGNQNLRLLPVMGQGSIQNISDVLYLKGVDLAIVQTDVLDFTRDRKLHASLERRINYISKLYNAEVHIVASSKYNNIKQLSGKKVAVGLKTDGAFVTASNIFEQNKIAVKPVFTEPDNALEMLKAGQIAAMVYVGGKPADLMQQIKREDSLKLLPIAMKGALAANYFPSRLTEEDYPNLIGSGAPVNTIATGTVLISFNWKPDTRRYKDISLMIETMFANYPQLLKSPNHAKWAGVNLAAKVIGWTRHPAVDEVLRQDATASLNPLHSCTDPAIQLALQKFFDKVDVIPAGGKPTPQQTEQLISDFKRWLASQPK